MQAIGHILPIALAAALSSVPIMVAIYILLSPNRRRSAVPFAIGWVIGILLVVVVCTFAAQLIPTPRSPRRPETTLAIIEIIVGSALVVLGVVSFRRARRRPDTSTRSLIRLERNFTPWESFGIGLLLNVRPKALLLAVAAGITIRGDAGSLSDQLIAIAVYTVIAASTVLIPVIATLVAPDRMEPRLTSLRDWLTRNGDAMTSLIVVLIAAVIIGQGLARL